MILRNLISYQKKNMWLRSRIINNVETWSLKYSIETSDEGNYSFEIVDQQSIVEKINSVIGCKRLDLEKILEKEDFVPISCFQTKRRILHEKKRNRWTICFYRYNISTQ